MAARVAAPYERLNKRLEQSSLPRPCGGLNRARCRCAAAAARKEGTRRRLDDDGRAVVVHAAAAPRGHGLGRAVVVRELDLGLQRFRFTGETLKVVFKRMECLNSWPKELFKRV